MIVADDAAEADSSLTSVPHQGWALNPSIRGIPTKHAAVALATFSSHAKKEASHISVRRFPIVPRAD